MSTSNVVRLGEYRDRREQRLRETMAMYGPDPDRLAVVRHLAEALTLLSADRAAVVWVDEYGPGLVHVYALLDLASDDPRRAFPISPLKAAWEAGVPGLLDQPDRDPGLILQSDRPRSQAVVSLGTDGDRAWFVVVDSMTPRPALSDESSEILMFFAGECAGVLLHRDLLESKAEESSKTRELGDERFAGWPVLRDMDGGEGEDETNRRISCRFMVSRVVRRLIEDDFAVDRQALAQEIDSVRREIEGDGTLFSGDSERDLWEGVLDRAKDLDLPGLASAALGLANELETRGHLYGARELHRCAYEVAVAAGAGRMAADALRFHARVCRKQGDLEDADYWYERAEAVARELEIPQLLVSVLTGRANLKRQVGNLPAARELLVFQEEVALSSSDPTVLAECHHGWMALEKDAGNWEDAVARGWQAFRAYRDEFDRLIVLADLGWTFAESGSAKSAEDAFTVLLAQNKSPHLDAVAREGMVRLAALKGDRQEFDRWLRRADDAWLHLQPATRAEARFYRAASFAVLGDLSRAADCLRKAREEARRLGVNRILIEAELRLEELEKARGEAEPIESERRKPLEDSEDGRVVEVLQGLSSLRATAQVGL